MRKIDLEKDKRLKQAVINLSYSEGFANLTTAKIAKVAGISPATIYLRYADKTDLLSRVYEETKAALHDGLDDAIDLTQSLDQQIIAAERFIVSQLRLHQADGEFVRVAWTNKELLDQHAIDYTINTQDALTDLFDRLDDSLLYTFPNRQALETFFAVPALALADQAEVSMDDIDQLSLMLIKSIRR